MAQRTVCARCAEPFTQWSRGRPASICLACKDHCAVEDCGRPARTAGFCNSHYERSRRGVDLSAPIEQREYGERVCKIDGCGRKRGHSSATYCVMHRQRVYVSGEPGPVQPKQAERGHAVWNTPNERRLVSRLYMFGLTPETFNELLASQGGRCAICGTDDPKRGNRVSTWTVDHDHNCCPGKKSCGRCVRGLLCSPCNRGLGLLDDDPVVVEAAAAYLRRYQQARVSLDA